MTTTLSPDEHTITDLCHGCWDYTLHTAGPGDGALTFPITCTRCGATDDGRRPR